MKKAHLLNALLSSFLIILVQSRFEIIPLGIPLRVVGLLCRNESDKSGGNIEAKSYNETLSKFFNDGKGRTFKHYHYKLMYTSFDVCDQASLSSSVVKLLLDTDFNIEETINGTREIQFDEKNVTVVNWKYKSTILWVYTYLNKELTKVLQRFIINIPVAKFDLHTDIVTFDEENKYDANTIKAQALAIANIMERFNFFSITAILFKGYSESIDSFYYHFHAIYSKKINICYKTEIIQTHYNNLKIGKILTRLANEDIKSAVIVFGDDYQLWLLNSISAKYNINLTEYKFWFSSSPVILFNIFEDGFVKKDQIYSLVSNGNKMPSYLGTFKRTPSEHVKQMKDVFDTFVHLVMLYNLDCLRDVFDYSQLSKKVFDYISDISFHLEKGTNELNIYGEMQRWKNNKFKCVYKDFCKPGWEQTFVKYTENETLWSYSIGYACRRCSKGYFKEDFGNSPCKQCKQPFIPNNDRTKCYDPYNDMHLAFDTKLGRSTFIVNTIFMTFTFIFTVTFYVKRKTPLARACDVFLTLTDLMCSMIIFTLAFLLFFGEKNILKCILRPSIIVFYSFDTAVILLKSQKLVSAFSAKRKLSKSNVKTTKAAQIFLIIFLTMIPLCFLFYLYLIQSVKIITTIDQATMQRFHWCSNVHYLNLLLAYVIVLQFCCFIQAFRARNIPNTFYNAMSIVYATLAGTLCLSTMYPIYYFQENPNRKLCTQIFALIINKFAFILKLYGQVLWKIVFKPEMNNKFYIRNELLRMNVSKANSRIST